MDNDKLAALSAKATQGTLIHHGWDEGVWETMSASERRGQLAKYVAIELAFWA